MEVASGEVEWKQMKMMERKRKRKKEKRMYELTRDDDVSEQKNLLG